MYTNLRLMELFVLFCFLFYLVPCFLSSRFWGEERDGRAGKVKIVYAYQWQIEAQGGMTHARVDYPKLLADAFPIFSTDMSI